MGIHPVPNEDLVNLPTGWCCKLRIEERAGPSSPTTCLLPAHIQLPQRAGPAGTALAGPSRTGDQPAGARFCEHAPYGGNRLGAHSKGLGTREPALDGRGGQPGRGSLPPARPRSAGPAAGADVIALKVRTRIEVAEAARTRAYRGDEELEVTRPRCWGWCCTEGLTVRVEKLAALYSSRDPRVAEPLEAAVQERRRYPFDVALNKAAREVCDAELRARSASSSCCASTPRICRCARGSPPITTRTTARGGLGRALQYLFSQLPAARDHARAPRFRRIEARAGRHAKAATRGRCSPGRAATGRRRPGPVHLNPLSGQFSDLSRNQRRAAIYCGTTHEVTHDIAFLRELLAPR